MQHKYFAASNSSQGFINYYPEVFERADHIYIIKGGPGTGKSSLMKKYALGALSKGYECEYYYCSSDPDSLDGVLIIGDGACVGVMDGTSPHVGEPKFPGAREEIINLGEFWNAEILVKQKNEIIALSERKSAEYKSAYTFLRSVGNLRAVSDGLLEGAIDRSKLRGAVSRFTRDFKEGKMKYYPSILDSVSMRGRVNFDSFAQNAKKLYIVSELYGVGQIFLDELFSAFKSKDVLLRVSFDPISPHHVDGIFVEKENIAFVTERNGLRNGYDEDALGHETVRINSKRFVDEEAIRDARSELRYTAKLAQSSLDGALYSLSKAKIYHFLLEDIYGKAMDWNRFANLKMDYPL